MYHAEDGIEKIYFDGEYIYLLPSYYRGKGITKIDLLGNLQNPLDNLTTVRYNMPNKC